MNGNEMVQCIVDGSPAVDKLRHEIKTVVGVLMSMVPGMSWKKEFNGKKSVMLGNNRHLWRVEVHEGEISLMHNMGGPCITVWRASYENLEIKNPRHVDAGVPALAEIHASLPTLAAQIMRIAPWAEQQCTELNAVAKYVAENLAD